MIKKISINILKILLAILISAILTISVGLWRLSETPIQIRSEIINRLIKVDNLKYGDVFLENPNLSALPTIKIHNIQFKNSDIGIESKQVIAKWHIFKLLYGKISIDSLEILQPNVSIHYKTKTRKKKYDVMVPQSIHTLQNLIEKTWLPANNILIKNGIIRFYKKNKKVGTIEDITFQYTTKKNINRGHLKISPAVGSQPIILSTTYNQNNRTLDYKLNSKDFLLKKSYLPYRIRPHLQKFENIQKKPITIVSKGKIKLSDTSISGDLKSTLSFFIDPDQKDEIQLTVSNLISTQKGELKVHTDASTNNFDWSYLSILWPNGMGSSARSWVLENMIGGTVNDTKASFDIIYQPEKNIFEIYNIRGTVGVKDTTVNYLGDLPKIQNTTAIAEFDSKKFDIKIVTGTAYNLKITNSNILLYDLDKPEQKADLNLAIQGPIKDALTLVNQKPLAFLKSYPILPSDFGGDTQIQLKLGFPLKSDLSPNEVKSHTNAKLNNLAYSHQIMDKKVDITSKLLELDVTNDGLKLLGDCEIDGHPSHIIWEESFKKDPQTLRIFKLKSDLSFNALAKYCPKSIGKFISNKDIIASQGTSDIALDFIQKNEIHSTLSLGINLSKNTFDFMPVKIRIPRGENHYFKAIFDFENGNLKNITPFDFNTSIVKVEGSAKYANDGSVEDIELKEITVKNDNIQISGQLKNNLLKLNAKASEISLFPILAHLKSNNQSQGTYKFQSNINAEISKLIMKDNIEIPNLIIQSTYKENNPEKIIITSKEKEETLFDLYYGPSEDKIIFELKSNSLGMLLSAFDITKDIQADLLYTKAEKLKNSPDPMIGNLKVKGLRVKNTSILSKLFSLMSLESLLTNLTGQGILFIKGNSEYEYENKKLAVKKAELTSSGIGLTSQGYIDIDQNLLDLYGVIIPANIFNQAITGIPLIGSILTGGKTDSGIISTSYTVKGPFSDPDVSANPLSVLAPTLVRSIFTGIFGSKEKDIGIRNFPALEPDNKKVEKIN